MTITNFKLGNVEFPSMEDLFRVSFTAGKENVLWCENKVSHEQWQCNVKDFTKHGPEGVVIPSTVIYSSLRIALGNINRDMDVTTESKAGNCATVDMQHSEGGLSMVLEIELTAIWKPQYTFVFVPIGLEPMDILSAQLRDAQEEIEKLRVDLKKRDVVYASLSSTTAARSGGAIVWNGTTPCELHPSVFQLSTDKTQLTVLEEGSYFINTRVCNTSGGDGHNIQLVLDSTSIAKCYTCNPNNYRHTADITEILSIKSNQILMVQYNGSGRTDTDQSAVRFTVQKLN